MKITVDRLKHSLAVATKMKKLAITDQKKYPVDPDEMFVLGFLHDIGYEFSEVQKNTPIKVEKYLESKDISIGKRYIFMVFHKMNTIHQS